LAQQLDQFRLEVERLLHDSKQSDEHGLNPLRELQAIFERLRDVENDKVSSILADMAGCTVEKQRKTPLLMASYLWIYEGLYTFCVDFFCSLLIRRGHDLFDEFNRSYVFSFEEVQGVLTATKLKFLKCHNFGIFERRQDRKLRNDIAHHNFVLDTSGVLKVDGKTVDIAAKYKDLVKFTISTLQVYEDCRKKVGLRRVS
jgi:hypothetical protein